jgi:hypothetical protein
MAGGRLGYSAEFHVTSIETTVGKIPDRLFTFEFPEDASVFDQDLKVYVRNTELTESHLAEVIQRAGGHRNLWEQWWFLLAACLAITGLGVCYVKWRARRTVGRS